MDNENKNDKEKLKKVNVMTWERKQDKVEVIKINKIIAENLDIKIDSIKDESNFVNDLGADSLNKVEIVIAIEEEFDIEISDDDADTLLTVGELTNYIANAEKIDRVAEAKKKTSLFFDKNGKFNDFWIKLLVIFMILFFGINTDYKYR